MKRYGGLWERVVSWDNLVLAARKAQRGKRDRDAVQQFNFEQERELLRLKTEPRERDVPPRHIVGVWASWQPDADHLHAGRTLHRTRLRGAPATIADVMGVQNA